MKKIACFCSWMFLFTFPAYAVEDYTSGVHTWVGGDFWADGTGRFGSRGAYVSAESEMSAHASQGSTIITLTSAAGFTIGSFIEVLYADGSIHSTDIASITGTTLTLRKALPSFTPSGTKVQQTAPVDPRGAIQIGRDIAAQDHSVIRIYRKGKEKGRIGLNAQDRLCLMHGASDAPAICVDGYGYIQLSILNNDSPSSANCDQSKEYGRMYPSHSYLWVCTSSGWKKAALQ